MEKSKEEKRVVIYCRESRDDYGENYERIETQRDLLLKFCKRQGYSNIVDIIMDDDKSGTDFSRFNDIRDRAKMKEIDVIVFKNSARLGRNQKEALDFVEFIEEQGVEIIFEDEQYNEEMFGLYAWFNERRARDDSKNIRRNLRHKIEEGELLIKAIYGYNKEGKKLIINETTAPIVKEIFELFVKGWNSKKIASFLNNKKVPTPSQSRNFSNAKQSTKWTIQNINRILDDRRYIGDYVGGKTEKISFKSKKIKRKPKEEWIIIKNHHDAIINEDLFEKVQRIRMEIKEKYHRDNIKLMNSKNNLYFGLLYCGRCKSQMYRKKGSGQSKKRPDCYICKRYCVEGLVKKNRGCKSHRIREEYLDEILKNYICKILSNEELQKYIIENVKVFNHDKVVLEQNLTTSKQVLKKLYNQYKQIYNDKLNNVIPIYIFNEKKQELDAKINSEGKKLQRIKDKINMISIKDKEELVFKAIEDIKNKGLKREELYLLFDKIVVYDKNEITKEEKNLYNLNDMMYNKLEKNGGLVFSLNFMYP